MGPDGDSQESFEGGDNLSDAVGQAMDETSEQGGSPGADADPNVLPGDAGQDDFAPDDAEDAAGPDDPSDAGL